MPDEEIKGWQWWNNQRAYAKQMGKPVPDWPPHLDTAEKRTASRKLLTGGTQGRPLKSHYADKPASTEENDYDWASANYALCDVSPMDAPSARAWDWMKQIRKKRDFLKELMMVRVRRSSENSDDAEIDRDCRKTERELTEAIDRIELAALN